MQDVFRNAVYHREPVVLRRQLLPLCLGHCYILLAAESPVVTGGRVDLKALAFAVGVCSRTFEDAQAWIKSDTLVADCIAWGKQYEQDNPAKDLAAFAEYKAEFDKFPNRFSKSRSPCHHPWPLLVAVALAPAYSESRSWNMPLPLALSYWSVLLGDDGLISDDELAAIAHMKAVAAAKSPPAAVNPPEGSPAP